MSKKTKTFLTKKTKTFLTKKTKTFLTKKTKTFLTKKRHLCRKNALTTSRQKLHKLFFAEKRLICP